LPIFSHFRGTLVVKRLRDFGLREPLKVAMHKGLRGTGREQKIPDENHSRRLLTAGSLTIPYGNMPDSSFGAQSPENPAN
jgi:hypothetical protein